MQKADFVKFLNELEETAKHECKWGKNASYYKGVIDCIKTIKQAFGVDK